MRRLTVVIWTVLIMTDATFFPGHAAAVHVRVKGNEAVIGAFGILHPTVLDKFELRYVDCDVA